MSILWHATPVDNRASIRERGLLCECSRGVMRVVWLHTLSMRADAVRWCAASHLVELDQVAVLAVRISRLRVTRFRTGLWYTQSDVPADQLVWVYDPADHVVECVDAPF